LLITIFIPDHPTHKKDESIMESPTHQPKEASSAVSAIPNCGKGIFNSVSNSEKRPLFG
jgi:hypothetical protein